MSTLPWCLCALHCLSEHSIGVSVSQVPLPSAVVGLVGTGWTDRDPAMPLLQSMQGWFPPRGRCFSPRRRSSVYLAARQHKRMINFRANTDPFRYGWNSPQKYLKRFILDLGFLSREAKWQTLLATHLPSFGRPPEKPTPPSTQDFWKYPAPSLWQKMSGSFCKEMSLFPWVVSFQMQCPR